MDEPVEDVDPNYKPTDDEVNDYAAYLEMDIEKYPQLRYLAYEGVKAPLPPPWKGYKSQNSGDVYYYNQTTGESVWEHPCDELYRKKYLEEKEKIDKGETVTTSANISQIISSEVQSSSFVKSTPVPTSTQQQQQQQPINNSIKMSSFDESSINLSPVKENFDNKPSPVITGTMKPVDESSSSIIDDSIESFSFGQSPVKPSSTQPVVQQQQPSAQQQLNKSVANNNVSMNIPEIMTQSNIMNDDEMNLPEIPAISDNNNNNNNISMSMSNDGRKMIENINNENEQQYRQLMTQFEDMKKQYKNNEMKLMEENNRLKQNIEDLKQQIDVKNRQLSNDSNSLVTQLQESKKQYERELNEKNDELSELNMKMIKYQDIENRMKSLQDQVNEYQTNEIPKLQNEYNELNNKYTKLEFDNQKLQNEKKLFQTQVSSLTEELSNHNLQSSQQSNTLLTQNTELRTAKAEAEKQIIELQNEILLKTQEYDKLQVDYNAVKKQNKIMEEQHKSEIESYESNISMYENTIKQMKETHLSLKNNVEDKKELMNELSDLKIELQVSTKTIEQYKTNLSNKTNEYEQLLNEIDILKNENQQLTERYNNINSRQSEQNDTISTITRKYENEISELKQDIVNKDNKLRDINNKYNDSLSKIKQLQSQVDIYSSLNSGKITIDETEYSELKNKNLEYSTSIDSLKSQIKSLEENSCTSQLLENQTDTINRFKEELDKLRSQYLESSSECTKLRTANQSLEIKLNNAESQIEICKSQVNGYQCRIDSINSEFNRYKTESEKGLLDSEVEKNINMNKLQNLMNENISLKNQMKSYSESEERYRSELMKMSKELNNNKEKLNIIEVNENDKMNKMKSLENDNSILKHKLEEIMNEHNKEMEEICKENNILHEENRNIKCELNSLKLVENDKDSMIKQLKNEVNRLSKYKIESKEIGINTIELPEVLNDLYKKNINGEYDSNGILKIIKYPSNNNNNNNNNKVNEPPPPPPVEYNNLSIENDKMKHKTCYPLKSVYNNESEDLSLISTTNMFNDKRINNINNKYDIYKNRYLEELKMLNESREYYKKEKRKLIEEKSKYENEREEWKKKNMNCKNASEKSYLNKMKKCLEYEGDSLNKEIGYLKEFDKWLKEREKMLKMYEIKLNDIKNNVNNRSIDDSFDELCNISNELEMNYNRLFNNNNNERRNINGLNNNVKDMVNGNNVNILPYEWLESLKNEILVELKRLKK